MILVSPTLHRRILSHSTCGGPNRENVSAPAKAIGKVALWRVLLITAIVIICSPRAAATTIDFALDQTGSLPFEVPDTITSFKTGVLFSEISGGPGAAMWDFTFEDLSFGADAVVRMVRSDSSLFDLTSLDITFRNSFDEFGTFDVVSSKGASQSIDSLGTHTFLGTGFQNISHVDFSLVKGGFFADNYDVDNIVSSVNTIDFAVNHTSSLPSEVPDTFSSFLNGVIFSEISGGPGAAMWDFTGDAGEYLSFGTDAVVRMARVDSSPFDLTSLDITFRNSFDEFGTFDVVSSKGASQSIDSLGTHTFLGPGFKEVDFVDFTLVKGELFADNYHVDNVVLQAVPEPSSMALLGCIGVVLLFPSARRKAYQSVRRRRPPQGNLL